MAGKVLVLGSFVADVAFRASRLPAWGETLMGSGFALGPGGKGSNQAVAAARAGARVQIVSKLGRDAFGDMARRLWADAGIDTSLVGVSDEATGAAAILIDQARGENAIVVVPGACFGVSKADVNAAEPAIREANVFLAQLELPLPTVERGLRVAREAGVTTVLNPAPAPAEGLRSELLALVDLLVPNESEAAALTGLPVTNAEVAGAAARALQSLGVRDVIVTLGERGALVCEHGRGPVLVPAFRAGDCVETTGAGDAFCGALTAGLSEGLELVEAARLGCAAAGISVTRAGTANSMPVRREIDALIKTG
jgi:ribokinase